MIVRVLCLVLILCFSLCGNSKSEIVQTPLPDLNGLYGRIAFNIPEWRTQLFSFENMPTSVDSAWITVRGIISPGLYTCEGFSTPEQIFMHMWADVSDSVAGGSWYTYGVDIETSGEYEISIPFEFSTVQEIDYSLRNDLLIELNHNWALLPMPGCTILEIATGFVEEVVLFVEGEFEVPVEENSWGMIKKLMYMDSVGHRNP